jgi:hypothetical protein
LGKIAANSSPPTRGHNAVAVELLHEGRGEDLDKGGVLLARPDEEKDESENGGDRDVGRGHSNHVEMHRLPSE